MKNFSDRTSSGWSGDKLPDNRRRVSTEHPLARHICARKASQNVPHKCFTHATRMVHCSVSQTSCHPSVMSHTLPHLPQNTSTRSLTFLPTILSLAVLSYLGPNWIGSRSPARPTAEWRKHEICISHKDRTPHRTHIFLSLVVSSTRTPVHFFTSRTHARLKFAQVRLTCDVWSGLPHCASQTPLHP